LNENHPGLQMRTKCKPTKSYDQKFFSSEDPLSQFVRIQYGANERGMISLRNIVDTFAGLDEAISDTGSTSGNEDIDEDNVDDNSGDNDDDDDEDDVDYVEEKNTSEQCDESLPKKTESDTKRKSSEAGCSEQNKTLPEKPENTKRMKMNTSTSTETNHLNSQSTNSSRNFWETMSGASSEPDDDDLDDSDSWVSSEENDNNDDDEFGGIYNSLVNGEDNYDSDTDSEVARELILYRFLSERKENELSKLLKGKIDLLPVPAMLKLYLNYNKAD